MKKSAKRNYDLKAAAPLREFPAPKLDYLPPQPRRYLPGIGLIGCGGITGSHLDAYRAAGWNVVALCDMNPEAAEARRKEFFPGAEVFKDYRELLQRKDIEVVDIALHPTPRATAIADALNADKHVLSQKPFVTDLKTGERLVALARKKRRKLAVNQNGRWSPYISWMNQAIRSGHIGEVQNVAINLNWDHTWIKSTPFEKIHHVVLYDFAIHWFDFTALFFAGRKMLRVSAANAFAPGQKLKPPMLASAQIEFENGLATLNFDAHSKFGAEESICVTGSAGTLRARGGICLAHNVTLLNARGLAKPKLEGKWFNNGFQGAMGELLCAIEESREPANNARDNLRSLKICYAAMADANTKTISKG
jgi:predicted dehydrogenase